MYWFMLSCCFIWWSQGNIGISLFHAFVATIGAIGEDSHILYMTLFYMIFDLITLPHKEPTSTYVHHILVIFTSIFVLWRGTIIEYAILMEFNEISTIFLNLRKLIPHIILDGLFAFTFFIFRILLIPYIGYHIQEHTVEFCLLLTFYALNLYWWYRICKKIIDKIYSFYS